METRIVTVNSKDELANILTSRFGDYSLFKGEVKAGGKRSVELDYWFKGNKLTVEVTYLSDGWCVEPDSRCSSLAGVMSKVCKFLDLK